MNVAPLVRIAQQGNVEPQRLQTSTWKAILVVVVACSYNDRKETGWEKKKKKEKKEMIAIYLCLLLVLAVSHTATAHLCILEPVQQRGGVYDGDFYKLQPGDKTCAAPVAPCNGKPSGKPEYDVVPGATIPFLIQQNLNHYTIGNPGHIDAAFSNTADPTSNDDFTVIDSSYMDDYPAFTEWTQTNLTVQVTIPKDAKPGHSVIRIRYVSNKPTEPEAFYSCVDVDVKEGNDTDDINQQHVPLMDSKNNDALQDTNGSTDSTDSMTLLGVVSSDDGTTSLLVKINPYNGAQTVVQEFPNVFRQTSPGGLLMDAMQAVDRGNFTYYLLIRANPEDQQPDEYRYHMVAFNYSDAQNETHYDNYTRYNNIVSPMPLMSFYFGGESGFVGLGMDQTEDGVSVVPLLIHWDRIQYVVTLSDKEIWATIPSYVDFKHSAYDRDTMILIAVLWHEDSADTLPKAMMQWNLAPGVTESKLSPHIWIQGPGQSMQAVSHFSLALPSNYTSGDAPVLLVALSPGVADKNGHIPTPQYETWVVDVQKESYRQMSDTLAGLNRQAPVWWGGAVSGHDIREDEFTFALIGYLEPDSMHTTGIHRPTVLQAVQYNHDGDIQHLHSIPYIHNVVQISSGHAPSSGHGLLMYIVFAMGGVALLVLGVVCGKKFVCVSRTNVTVNSNHYQQV